MFFNVMAQSHLTCRCCEVRVSLSPIWNLSPENLAEESDLPRWGSHTLDPYILYWTTFPLSRTYCYWSIPMDLPSRVIFPIYIYFVVRVLRDHLRGKELTFRYPFDGTGLFTIHCWYIKILYFKNQIKGENCQKKLNCNEEQQVVVKVFPQGNLAQEEPFHLGSWTLRILLTFHGKIPL